MFQQELEEVFQARSCSWKIKTISQSQPFQAAKVLKVRNGIVGKIKSRALQQNTTSGLKEMQGHGV